MEPIYLDHNATTPILPAVAEAMHACYQEGLANPASPHGAGRRARRRLEEAREGIGRILQADLQSRAANDLIFTSGGTEANNLALRGLAGNQPGRLIVSSIEHPSTLETARWLQKRGWTVQLLRVLQNGQVDLDHLETLLKPRDSEPPPQVVSVMWANNETGVIQPIDEISRRCRAVGSRFHCDAVQVVGKIPVDFARTEIDALTIAAHKFHGPVGIGGLFLRRGVHLEPILFGGHQQRGLRPGTEPIALAVGMHVALQLWEQQREQRILGMRTARDTLEQRLRQEDPKVEVNGEEPRLPHATNLSFLDLDRQALWMALDLAGVQCSTGSACASGASDPSHVLQAMGLDAARIESALRLSVGATTTVTDVESAVGRILNTVRHLRRRDSPLKSSSSARETQPEGI